MIQSVQFEQSTKSVIQTTNTLANTTIGLNVIGDCQTAEQNIRGNRVSNHKIGWNFRSLTGKTKAFGNVGDATANTQDNANLWQNNFYTYGTGNYRKVYRSTFANDQTILNINIQDQGISTKLSQAESQSNTANGKYNVQLLSFFTEFEGCQAPSPLPKLRDESGLGEDEALQIASGAGIAYPMFDEVADYTDKMYLYSTLDNEASITNPNLNTFYNNNTSTNIGRLHNYEAILNLLSDSTTVSDSLVLDSLKGQLIAVQNNFVNYSRTYENSDKNIMMLQYQISQTGLAGLSNAQKEYISNLANSCPAAIGNSVYKARTLNAMLTPALQYNDFMLCASYLPQNKTGKNMYALDDDVANNANDVGLPIIEMKADFDVYPNPVRAKEHITIVYDLGTTTNAKIVIYDMIGQVVQTNEITNKTKRLVIELAKVPLGVYKLVIEANNKTLKSAKLVIN
jgi:Secretion system C-terminal sorting domain